VWAWGWPLPGELAPGAPEPTPARWNTWSYGFFSGHARSHLIAPCPSKQGCAAHDASDAVSFLQFKLLVISRTLSVELLKCRAPWWPTRSDIFAKVWWGCCQTVPRFVLLSFLTASFATFRKYLILRILRQEGSAFTDSTRTPAAIGISATAPSPLMVDELPRIQLALTASASRLRLSQYVTRKRPNLEEMRSRSRESASCPKPLRFLYRSGYRVASRPQRWPDCVAEKIRDFNCTNAYNLGT
jgi:hypothetical protein